MLPELTGFSVVPTLCLTSGLGQHFLLSFSSSVNVDNGGIRTIRMYISIYIYICKMLIEPQNKYIYIHIYIYVYIIYVRKHVKTANDVHTYFKLPRMLKVPY